MPHELTRIIGAALEVELGARAVLHLLYENELREAWFTYTREVTA